MAPLRRKKNPLSHLSFTMWWSSRQKNPAILIKDYKAAKRFKSGEPYVWEMRFILKWWTDKNKRDVWVVTQSGDAVWTWCVGTKEEIKLARKKERNETCKDR